MTPEQLKTFLESITEYTTESPEACEAWDAAQHDLTAMRQPITADALEQAGWVHDAFDHEWYTRRIDGLIVEFNLAGEPSVLIETRAPGCRIIPECRTMYDLGELVRVLAERPERR